jgi:hypothetical protein
MSTVLILGAGGTAGAKGLPVDRDFLQRSINLIRSYEFLPLALEFLYPEGWLNQRLEDAWSNIDSRFSSPLPISDELTDRILNILETKATDEDGLSAEMPRYYREYRKERIQDPQKRSPAQYLFLFAGWELRQAICRAYGQPIPGGQEKYRDLLAEYEARGPVSVIDFNYDVYLEEAMDTRQWFSYPEASPQRDAIEILKPHGSLNWIHRRVWEPDEEIVPTRDVYPASSWGFGPEGFSQASIIPMTRAKREFTSDEESETIRLRYGGIMRRCADVLMQAQHICVVGYSFPPGDRYFQDLLRKVQTGRVMPPVSAKYIQGQGDVGYL